AEKGSLSFDVHGQLYYPLVAWFMRGEGYGRLLRLLHLTNLLTFVLAAGIFYHTARRRTGCSRTVASIVGVCAALTVGSLLQYLQGRPDHGIVVTLVIFGLFSRWEGSPIISGLRIGIVGAISPLPAYLLGMMTVWSDSLREKKTTALVRNSLLSFIVALSCWALLTSLVYPGSLTNLLLRTVSDGAQENGGLFSLYQGFPSINIPRMIQAWVAIKYIPFIIAPLAFTATVALTRSIQKLRGEGSAIIRMVALIFLVVLPGQLWFLVVVWPEIHYSLIGLYPAMILWSLRQISAVNGIRPFILSLVEKSRGIEAELRLQPSQLRDGLVIMLAFSTILPGLGYLRTSLLQRTVLNAGVDYQSAYERFTQLKGELAGNEYILISEYTTNSGRSAVVLDGPPWRSRASVWGDDINESFTNLRGRFFFTLQDSLADTNIPTRAHGYRLTENRLTTSPVSLLGFRLASVTPGYAYAIYERE
ncbi:MAG: hypothetical protein EBZ36_16180, partial [Acidobacteria bacterium]|nr:hypothetical protein [Acidobacteriota bacterium]